MTQKLKRYDLIHPGGYCICKMENDSHGEFVSFADYQKLLEQLGKAEDVLNKAIVSAEFFSRHADCRKDTWTCRCEFCKDTTASKNLREARQYFKEKENND